LILFCLAGFSYYGTESMYSGTTGLQFEVDIFIGVVYYQRLRHLVSDKFQVRKNKRIEQILFYFRTKKRFEQLVLLMP
jgi:DNA-directed RNA polymerase beta subunit